MSARACELASHDFKPSRNWLCSVCSCLYRMSYMCPAIDNPASCEIGAVISFLRPKNMNAAEIYRELCASVYSLNVMTEGTVRQWCRMFKDGRANECSRLRAKWSAIYSE
jgi:hypothetical protein